MNKIYMISNVGFNDFIVMMPRCGMLFYIYTNMYIIRWFYMMIRCHEDTVILRSTTDPYGRPVIEVAYGEIILSLHRSCIGDDSSGRVVGVSAWCIAHVWHTRVNTNVDSVYIIFWFLRYKNICIYIVFKIYM